MKNKELYNYWSEFNSSLNQNEVEVCYYIFESFYLSSERYYHNFEHVKDLLNHIQYEQSITEEERRILIYTAFFHDLVYDPKRKDNECNSASVAGYWLKKIGVSESIIKKVSQIIHVTEKHKSDDCLSNLFIDMDLSILGSEPEKYLEYANKIRFEFSHLSNFLYRIGRKRFLKKLLSRPKIYMADTYYSKYEMVARRNLQTELNAL